MVFLFLLFETVIRKLEYPFSTQGHPPRKLSVSISYIYNLHIDVLFLYRLTLAHPLCPSHLGGTGRYNHDYILGLHGSTRFGENHAITLIMKLER